MRTTEILTTRSAAHDRVLAMRRRPVRQLRPLAGVLQDQAWAGERCFILGGGPSLRGFDFAQLAGEKVIGINRAFQFWPEAQINFAMDVDFHGWVRRSHLAAAWAEFKGLKVWLDMVGYPFSEEILTVNSLGEQGIPTSLVDGIYHGANSGYGAIQLALLLGAAPIYLLGYDMQFDAGRAHFYDGPAAPPERVYKGFIPALDALAREIETGRVINLNPGSALQGFPKAAPETVLGRR